MKTKEKATDKKVELRLRAPSGPGQANKQTSFPRKWTKGVCPNCGYTKADVDPEGITWCPACGYSKKGCYT